ncbi:MAG: sigma-70 family RNA polymerase sigma factor [Planctomycetia bacterium]|nr:sigma-70 family RNA polymerase sigma factor [Planctomycetia bacterium]
MPNPAPDLPNAAHAHAAFVRAVARGVLGRDRDVEDVLQDTFVIAQDRQPRRAGSLRAWLATIARRLALDRLRSDGRRARRERVAAHAEALPDVTELLVREEARRSLVEAVARLDGPYRTVVLWRYYAGKSVAEIAALMDVPIDTVRSRLQRALVRLREDLDAHHEGRRDAWAGALGPLLGDGATADVVAAVTGGGVAKALVVAATALIVLGGGVWLVARERADDSIHGARPTPVAAVPSEAATAAAPPLAPVGPGLASRGGDRAPVSSEAEPLADGIVVDEQGRPVAGVEVRPRVRRLVGRDADGLDDDLRRDLAFEVPPGGVALAVTDDAGRFTVRGAPDGLLALVFTKRGFGVVEHAMGNERSPHDLRIVVTAGRTLEGTVRDDEGAPIAGANVSYARPFVAGRSVPMRTFTDADGVFRFEHLPADTTAVAVSAFGYAHRFVDVVPGSDRIEVRLSRTSWVVDVIDAASGAPLGDARAVLVALDDGRVLAVLRPVVAMVGVTTRPGRLILGWLDLGDAAPTSIAARLHVFAPGYTPVTHDVRVPTAPPPHLRLSLTRGAAAPVIAGRVTGPTGAVVHVLASGPEADAFDDVRAALASVASGPDGAFAVAGLPPGRYRLVAEAEGFARTGVNVDAPEPAVELSMAPEARLEIVGVGPGGEPAPGTPFSVISEEARTVWTARADGAGVATVRALPAGAVRVVPGASWRDAGRVIPWSVYAPWSRPVVLRAGEATRVEVPVPARVPVTFVVRDDGGAPRPGVRVRLTGGGWAMTLPPREDEPSRVAGLDLVTDADGRATASLFPGPYGSCRLVDGTATTEVRVNVPMTARPVVEFAVPGVGATLRGRVVEARGGAPVGGRPVSVIDLARPERGRVATVVTDADGRYDVAGLAAGLHRVIVSGGARPDRTADAGSPFSSAQVDVDLERGAEAVVDFALPRLRGDGAETPTVELSVRVTDAATSAPLPNARGSALGWRDGRWIHVGSFETGADGSARAMLLAAERYRIFAGRFAPTAPSYPTQEREVVPSAGRVAVDLPLPVDERAR